MEEGLKQKMIDSMCKDACSYQDGFWVTLNAITSNLILFESQIERIMHWTNEYCFGRNYKRGVKSLRIFGHPEIGGKNDTLHGHWLLLHNNDTSRSIEEANFFMRRKWYKLINARGDIFGNLVNVQKAGNIEKRIEYMSKDFYRQQNFNPLYF